MWEILKTVMMVMPPSSAKNFDISWYFFFQRTTQYNESKLDYHVCTARYTSSIVKD